MTQGTSEDNVRDELNEAAGWAGARGENARRPPRGSEAAWLQGVKDTVQDEWSVIFRLRSNSPEGNPARLERGSPRGQRPAQAGGRAEIVGRETHAPLNPVAFVSTYGYASDAASLGEAIR
jgi:hypothetical protein